MLVNHCVKWRHVKILFSQSEKVGGLHSLSQKKKIVDLDAQVVGHPSMTEHKA